MSTKIFNAYKFDGSVTDLISMFQDFRKKWISYQVDKIVYLLENQETQESKNEKLHRLFVDMDEQSSKQINSYSDVLDIKGSATVYFVEDVILVQFFIDTERFKTNRPVFTNDPRFSDFHYQNQTDPYFAFQEDLTDEEKQKAEKDWSERKRLWDLVFETVWSPREVGLTFDFASADDIFDVKLKTLERLRDSKWFGDEKMEIGKLLYP